jgi:hypothetical protein
VRALTPSLLLAASHQTPHPYARKLWVCVQVFEVNEDATKFRRKVPFVAPTDAAPIKVNDDRAVVLVQNVAKGECMPE